MARKRIGELLVEAGAITREQLDAGLAAQAQTRKKLGLTLVEQGTLSEAQLAHVLAASLSLKVVDLRATPVDWSAVHMLRARFCESHELFPYGIEGKGTAQKTLLIAMSDPLNMSAQEEVAFTTGLKVRSVVATYGQVREAILKYYHKITLDDGDKMTVVDRGGAARDVGDARPPPPPADDEPAVVMGEEIKSGPSPVPPPPAASGKKQSLGAAVSKDLDFLFGGEAEDSESIEKLERHFWALMRLLAKKGVLTRDEFFKELEKEP